MRQATIIVDRRTPSPGRPPRPRTRHIGQLLDERTRPHGARQQTIRRPMPRHVSELLLDYLATLAASCETRRVA